MPAQMTAAGEGIAAPRGTWSRRLQRCVAPVTRRLDAGCDPGRETWRAIRAAGFREVQARWYSRRALLGIYSPSWAVSLMSSAVVVPYGHCLGGVAHV